MYKPILYGFCFIVCFWVVVLTALPKHGTVKYDCRLAEISPDFPAKVKEECRKLQAKNGRI